jgi:methanethiol S-methyltransferase
VFAAAWCATAISVIHQEVFNMGRVLAFLYGIVAYVTFFISFTYAIGFVGNFIVPKSIDSGVAGNAWTALVIDALLLTLFAVQHSGMARRGFKRWLTRVIPAAIERSTYVLVASLVLLLLYAAWRPIPATVWRVTSPTGVLVLQGLFAIGWATVFLSTVMIGHFDLFGLNQVWLNMRGRMREPDTFRIPDRLLGDTAHERWASAVRHRHDGLHPHRSAARGARPDRAARREVSAVQT